jgi:hypothetical protein
MSVRNRVRMYGLKSQRLISQARAVKLLKSFGYVLNEQNKNCLYLTKESMKHWLTKAAIFKILRDRGRVVGTEIELGGGIADVIDVDNFIVYEIEKELNERKKKEKASRLKDAKDVFIIDLKEVPDDFDKAEIYLGEKVV